MFTTEVKGIPGGFSVGGIPGTNSLCTIKIYIHSSFRVTLVHNYISRIDIAILNQRLIYLVNALALYIQKVSEICLSWLTCEICRDL